MVGVDWRVPLDVARRRVGGRAVQGSLDPALCLAPWPVVEEATREVLGCGGGRGHVFNLGHGVLPETDPTVLEKVVASSTPRASPSAPRGRGRGRPMTGAPSASWSWPTGR